MAELVHTDSGFDEAMEDIDLDASNLTETPRIRRVRTYVSDDDDEDEDFGDGFDGKGEAARGREGGMEMNDELRQEGACMPE